jgi:DNA-directed RNA polymerase specialized sigma subunit
MNDKDEIQKWQDTKDPNVFAGLMLRFQPIINSVVNKFRTVGLPPATLRAQAMTQTIKAFDSYDPTKGTVPSTHVWNNLQKVYRGASESLMSGHIPENRALQRSTFTIVKDNLTERLGRDPNVDELSDELHWDRAETGRMLNELKGEITASGAEFDFYGNSTTGESKDKVLVDYMYNELKGPQKVIFEHTFGYGGKSVLNNKEIAKKINKNEMWVHREKKKMSDRIKEYR